jgi:hypothetical protein
VIDKLEWMHVEGVLVCRKELRQNMAEESEEIYENIYHESCLRAKIQTWDVPNMEEF